MKKLTVLVLLEMQKEGNDLLPKVMRYETLLLNRKVPVKVTPTTNPIAVGLVPAQTNGDASQAAGLAPINLLQSLRDRNFKKSQIPQNGKKQFRFKIPKD